MSSAPSHASAPTPSPVTGNGIGLVAATALGVGGMMGAGLYTLLGLAAASAGAWLPVSFAVAGLAAVFSVYSYSKLGATYPSTGGAAQFIRVELGTGTVSGGVNVFQFVAYLIATSLYAAGFAEYVGALVGGDLPSWAGKAIGAGIVVVFTIVNLLGSRLVGRAETVIIAIETVILVGFVVLGLFKADPQRVTSAASPGLIGVITGAALLYVTYQGFGVVANASGQMRSPRKELPRAMFSALAIVGVIYVVVSALVVALVPLSSILADSGHVLADAGEAIAGRAGFVVISGAALLATASAVNATIFAASSVGADLAAHRQLPSEMSRDVDRRIPIALLVSAVVVVLLVLFFPLSAVGQMTSLAFLVVYGAVSAGHLRLRSRTGARAWPLVLAVLINAGLFAALLVDTVRTGPVATWVTLLAALAGSFVFAFVWGRRREAAARHRGDDGQAPGSR
ncbi:MAG: amino acid permease [Actinomycetales bacterium]|nr:amino acid permease [Actinomycetales bacterium]